MKQFLLITIIILFGFSLAQGQTQKPNISLDEKVRKFLAEQKNNWTDLNVPEQDGKLLYDIIIKNNYKSALEIGTSTGHSGIWIAWALSKTGGKLITIEIDKSRHNKAIENFKNAGLSDYIDSRLADAHILVKELPGPFDFIFSDADKEWYINYFKDLNPKLKVGGRFTAHNISRSRWAQEGTQEFLKYIQSFTNYETSVDDSGSGLSISYKKKK
jgi:caffeoyl-CoA O-methyltransferase